MNGFERAQAEYERKLFNPYDDEETCIEENEIEVDRQIKETILEQKGRY